MDLVALAGPPKKCLVFLHDFLCVFKASDVYCGHTCWGIVGGATPRPVFRLILNSMLCRRTRHLQH